MFRSNSVDDGGFPSADWTSDLVWLVKQANQQIGPLSTLQLAPAAKNGLLAANALIWREGLPRWFAADEIAGLLPVPPPRPVRQQSVSAGHPAPTRHSDAVERLIAERAARAAVPATPVSQNAIAIERHSNAWAWNPHSSASSVTSTPLQSADEPYQSLRALMYRRESERAATASSPIPLPKSGEMLPAPRYDRPPVASATVASFAVTEHLARNLADSIVLVLERHRIKTIDDLTSVERLRQLAAMIVENLPGTVKLGLAATVGRSETENKIFELLEHLRLQISRKAREKDLRDLVEEIVPPFAHAIEAAVVGTATTVGSFVMSNIAQAVAVLRREAPANAPAPMLPAPVT